MPIAAWSMAGADLSSVRDRAAVLARAHAARSPRKAATQGPMLERQVGLARTAGNRTEVARLQGIIEGYTAELRHAKRCVDCGKPLKDPDQPGFVESIGPDCWRKRSA
jgi:hypothetical protein